MKYKNLTPLVLFVSLLIIVSLACSTTAPQPTPTNTAKPTATITLTPTKTPKPSATPRPTRTPNLAATQRMEGFNTETKSYFDKGYIKTTDGKIKEYDDTGESWAQLGWYKPWQLLDDRAQDFYLSAHFKWSSAYRNADASGCGFMFAIQDNGDHYAVFLDRSKVVFLYADTALSYSRPVGLTRGTGHVKFDNPADHPAESDFTIIVTGAYTYVIVDGEVVGEYTLAQSKILEG